MTPADDLPPYLNDEETNAALALLPQLPELDDCEEYSSGNVTRMLLSYGLECDRLARAERDAEIESYRHSLAAMQIEGVKQMERAEAAEARVKELEASR